MQYKYREYSQSKNKTNKHNKIKTYLSYENNIYTPHYLSHSMISCMEVVIIFSKNKGKENILYMSWKVLKLTIYKR